MHRTRVKICGITRVEDIVNSVESGVDALGFVFVESSPRCVTIEQARSLIKHVPPFVQTVGLFMNQSSEFIRAVLNEVSLNLLQFHGEETPVQCELHRMDYIKAIAMGGGSKEGGSIDVVNYAAQYADSKGFLLDSHELGQSGGSGEAFDWSKVPRKITKPLILAGGLTTENIAAAVSQVKPYAVDVSSGVEAAKGIKDKEKIVAFIRGVRQGDESTS